MPEWNNHIMKKYGQSIRKKIAEAYLPFSKGMAIVSAYNIKEKLNRADDAADTRDE